VFESRGDVEVETVSFLCDISYASKLSNTSVLELGKTVLVEGLLVDISGESTWIPESGWLNNSKSILVTG
jgi:hypothetical protein